MDEQPTILPNKSTNNRFFFLRNKLLIGPVVVFFFLLLFFLINFFGLYNFSEKMNFLRFLPTKEGPLVQEVNTIMSIIQNPDPKLLAKYNVPKGKLEDEQAIILCGGYPNSDRELVLDENKCLSDSLVGIRKAVKAKDMPQALTLIKKLYPTVSNSSFNDTTQLLMSNEEALKIDPQKKFLMFASDIPNARPEMKDRAVYIGSEIKKPAAFELIKLWYSLKNQ